MTLIHENVCEEVSFISNKNERLFFFNASFFCVSEHIISEKHPNTTFSKNSLSKV